MNKQQINMHILEIPSWFSTSDNPHYAPFTEEHARMLLKRGVRVGVLYPHFQGGFIDRLYGGTTNIITKNVDGLTVYDIRAFSIIPKVLRINYLYTYRNAKKAFRKYCLISGFPDLLHAHSTLLGGFVAMKLSRQFNIPYVISKHSTPFLFNFEEQEPYDKKALKMVIENAAAAIFVSSFAKMEYSRIYGLIGTKMHVINNPVNDLFFENAFMFPRAETFRFVSISALREVKNLPLLIQAVKLLIKTKNLTIDIYGEGPLKNELMDLIRTEGLENTVFLRGGVSRLTIREVVENAHALVSASRLETFGINLIEALACGKPVVAMNSGGPADIVNDFNGVLIDEYSAEALANGMNGVIENYAQFDAQRIRDDCRERFSEDTIFEKTMALYNAILKRNDPGAC